ncbi:MAG: hypothetical protein ACI9O6_000002 [Glaciecola sp.]|jgi:hypothetical protein
MSVRKWTCTNRHPITRRHPRAGEDPPHYIVNVNIAPVRLLDVQGDPRLREEDFV